jgi:AraC family transcriptional regulator
MDRWANREEYVRRLNRVLDHIETHLGEELSLEELAAVAAFSPFHFHRVFLAMVGEPLGAFIRRLRLERAAFVLVTRPRLPVTQLALESGFGSSAAFARAFKERFGLSATEYRSKNCKANGKQGKAQEGGAVYAALRWVDGPPADAKEEAMECRIEEMKALRAAYVRRLGPYDHSAAEAWEVLCRWAGPRGLLGPGAMLFGLSYDDPETSPAQQLRYDACLAVGPQVKAEGEVGLMELPAGKVARFHYEGPGEGIIGVYKRIYGDWLPGSGFVPAPRPPLEIYLKSPEDNHFVLDICLPVEPA